MTCQCSRAPPPPPATVTWRRLLYMAITLFGTGLVMSMVILFNFCAGNSATCLSLLRTHGSWQIDALHAHIQCGAEQRSRTRIFFSDFKKLRFFFLRWRVKKSQVVIGSFVLSPSKWVHILRSVITVIHFSCLFVSLVYLRTYRHLSHTVLSCIVSCECEHYVHISARGVWCWWLTGADFR